MAKVLDPWAEDPANSHLRADVMESLVWLQENLDKARKMQSAPGQIANVRRWPLDNGVTIDFLLPDPHIGIHLVAIDSLEST